MIDDSHSVAHAAQSHVAQAQVDLKKRRIDEARQSFERALEADPDCLEAHFGLAQIRFPGLPYLDVLARIHQEMRPETYVEIGVATGVSMAKVLPFTRCIGIDPAPTLEVAGEAAAEIFNQTSDQFFAQNDLNALLGGKSLRLGFIDGLHLFENVLSDFINLERYCGANSALLIHDCLPVNARVASRKRKTRFWTGDVWRILPTLARFRPDLSISVIMTGPSGLAVVRNLDRTSETLTKVREKSIAYGFHLDISALENLMELGIHIVPSEWPAIAPLFAR